MKKWIIAFVASMVIFGCTQSHRVADYYGSDDLGAAQARLDTIEKNAEDSALVKQQAQAAQENLKHEGDNRRSILKSNADSFESLRLKYVGLQTEVTELNLRWYVKWGKRVDWVRKIWLTAVVILVVMRVVALFLAATRFSALGAILSMASTVSLGILFAFVPLLLSGADNVYFRIFKKDQPVAATEPIPG